MAALLNVSMVLSVLAALVSTSKPSVRYQHFDEYLKSLDNREQSWITGDAGVEGSGDEARTPLGTIITRTLPIRTGLVKNKDVTCCMLGQMAGDKGYHCFVKFYVARLLMRNRNRAHNRKMAFYGPNKIPNYGEKLMRTFEQCVAGRGNIFHKCCHLATLENRPKPHYDTNQRNRYLAKKGHTQQDTYKN